MVNFPDDYTVNTGVDVICNPNLPPYTIMCGVEVFKTFKEGFKPDSMLDRLKLLYGVD